MTAPPARCWVCRGPILNNSCLHCARDVDDARAGLWRGIRNALAMSAIIAGGVSAGFLLRWWV